MTQKLKAIYQNGTFVPQSQCYLPNNAEVELTVRQRSFNLDIIDPEARKQILKALTQRMRQKH
jgi:predicted DNA-binding antitoxin AbrB/MazE fold protein